MDNQQGPTAQWNSAQSMWQPGWKGSLGENVYIWQSFFAVHLKLSQQMFVNWLYSNTKKFFKEE